ncbi:MAG: hypothetical protein FWG25_10410, partial [Promicromonosporaceae bacterium]|nr:hypothetical protein [Promicromonosporaceae bacterium]
PLRASRPVHSGRTSFRVPFLHDDDGPSAPLGPHIHFRAKSERGGRLERMLRLADTLTPVWRGLFAPV